MKYKLIQTIFLSLILLFSGMLSFSYAQSNVLDTLKNEGFMDRNDVNPTDSFGSQNRYEKAKRMLLLDSSPLSESLFNSDGFAALFNTLLNIIITLAAIWAVIELSYYGAKYALIDSFTGKKDAIKNIWPVVYGLIALLGIYLFFKQINPKILELELGKDNRGVKMNLSDKIKPSGSGVGIDCVRKTSSGICISQYTVEQEKIEQEKIKDRYKNIENEIGTNPKYYKKYFTGKYKIEQMDFCKDNKNYNSIGACAASYNKISQCVRTSLLCDKVSKDEWRYLDLYINGTKDTN